MARLVTALVIVLCTSAYALPNIVQLAESVPELSTLVQVRLHWAANCAGRNLWLL